VIRACPSALVDIPSRELWRQLIRAAMGSTGNLEEADEASSTADFVHKMKIALRETREAKHWLRILHACQLGGSARAPELEREAGELAAIFAQIILNVKARVGSVKHPRGRTPEGEPIK
jgi:four helix bundle protein